MLKKWMFANAVDACGVWACKALPKEDVVIMQRMGATVPGAVFYEGTASEVNAWTCAAADTCKDFRKVVGDFIARYPNNADETGPESCGRRAFIRSLRALL